MPSRDPHRPNILVILTDDLGCWALGCAGNQEIRTPNLDRLAASGTRFENFFCASPVCSPSRATLLTGLMPSRHGVHDWIRGGNTLEEGPIDYLQSQLTYPDLLAQAGWVCGLSGKWHLGDSARRRPSYRFWYAHQSGGGPYYGAPVYRDGEPRTETAYITEAITDEALNFLRGPLHADGQPFCLQVTYTAPHSPWVDSHPADFVGLYDDCPFATCPEEPPHPDSIDSAPWGTGEERRRQLAGYFAAVSAMDAQIGRVIDWLEAAALRESTFIFFTSDNGMNMGHHGIWGKGNGTFPQNMFDTSVKVPAIASQPGRIRAGGVCEAMLSHYDFVPTVLRWAGLQHPYGVVLPGRAFERQLDDPAARPPGPDEVVVCDEYGPVRMIRTPEWKYVHRYPYGPHELYDLREDPDERCNLMTDDAPPHMAVELRRRLEEWFVRATDPNRDGRLEPVTGKGQLRLAGRLAGGEQAFAGDYHHVAEKRRAQLAGE